MMEVVTINVKSLKFDEESEVAPGEPAGGEPEGGFGIGDISRVWLLTMYDRPPKRLRG